MTRDGADVEGKENKVNDQIANYEVFYAQIIMWSQTSR